MLQSADRFEPKWLRKDDPSRLPNYREVSVHKSAAGISTDITSTTSMSSD